MSIARGVLQHAISRAIRLWPVVLFNLASLHLVGDSLLCTDFKTRAWAFLQCLTFTYNYFDVKTYGSLTMTVMWSVCADFQTGVVLVALLFSMRRILRRDTAFMACARGVLLSLLIASFVIRVALFDVTIGNDVLMGKRPHLGTLLTKISYKWMRDYLGFNLSPDGIVSQPLDLLDDTMPDNSPVYEAAKDNFAIMARLYFPTHARFGAMVIGMLMAFCLETPLSSRGKVTSTHHAYTLKNSQA